MLDDQATIQDIVSAGAPGRSAPALPWWLHWGRLRLSGSQIVEEDRRGSVLAPLRSRQLQAVIKEATECVLSIAGFWRHGPVPHEAQL